MRNILLVNDTRIAAVHSAWWYGRYIQSTDLVGIHPDLKIFQMTSSAEMRVQSPDQKFILAGRSGNRIIELRDIRGYISPLTRVRYSEMTERSPLSWLGVQPQDLAVSGSKGESSNIQLHRQIYYHHDGLEYDYHGDQA